jgi:hypothetical protein
MSGAPKSRLRAPLPPAWISSPTSGSFALPNNSGPIALYRRCKNTQVVSTVSNQGDDPAKCLLVQGIGRYDSNVVDPA